MMSEDNLLIGAATDGDDYAPGIHSVRIRMSITEPYVETNILIVRPAAKEEYIAYHQRENLKCDITPDDQYFAFYID